MTHRITPAQIDAAARVLVDSGLLKVEAEVRNAVLREVVADALRAALISPLTPV